MDGDVVDLQTLTTSKSGLNVSLYVNKAHGMGGLIICDELIKKALIDTMRPVIFSTNLPSVNVLWS